MAHRLRKRNRPSNFRSDCLPAIACPRVLIPPTELATTGTLLTRRHCLYRTNHVIHHCSRHTYARHCFGTDVPLQVHSGACQPSPQPSPPKYHGGAPCPCGVHCLQRHVNGLIDFRAFCVIHVAFAHFTIWTSPTSLRISAGRDWERRSTPTPSSVLLSQLGIPYPAKVYLDLSAAVQIN